MEGGGADVFLLPNHKTRFFGIVKSVKSSRSYFSTGLVEPDFYYLLPFLTKAMVKSKQKTIEIVQCQIYETLTTTSELEMPVTPVDCVYEPRLDMRYTFFTSVDGRRQELACVKHCSRLSQWEMEKPAALYPFYIFVGFLFVVAVPLGRWCGMFVSRYPTAQTSMNRFLFFLFFLQRVLYRLIGHF